MTLTVVVELWKAKGCYDMFWLVMACCGWPKGLLLLDV
jgi:hypothetical protein